MSPASTRKTSNNPIDQLTYEQAVKELESIITVLESQENSLDECMALFERGQGLIYYCANLLDQADLKVQQLCADSLTEYKPLS